MNRALTHIDCGAGVAGDMLLGALFGLGLSPQQLERALRPVIPAQKWKLRVRQVERRLWPAWSLVVVGDRPYTSSARMLGLVEHAPLPGPVRKRAHAILSSLRWAERQAHGTSAGHFDPKGLGRLDTLVDVIGSAWGFWKLGIGSVTASALNTGRIAPATAKLASKAAIPIYSDGTGLELATPTGTAILSHVVDVFTPMPPMVLEKAGYGAGTLDRDGKPNVLAIYQGKSSRKLLK